MTIDFPGATETQAAGISGSEIVGFYKESGTYHGFLFDGVKYTTLDDPLATNGTFIRGISDGRIVGSYSDEHGSHGFVYDGLTYTTLDDPAAAPFSIVGGETGTIANGIDNGKIVGYYLDTYTHRHGFIYDGSTYTKFDVPGAFDTEINGVDGGNIVGWYMGADSQAHSYLYDGSHVINLDNPFGWFDSYARGIDGNNIVGGYAESLNGSSHGYLYNGSSYSILDDPSAGPPGTWAGMGIDGEKIVGIYYDPLWNVHGFLATVPEPSTTLLFACCSLGLLCRRRLQTDLFRFSRVKVFCPPPQS